MDSKWFARLTESMTQMNEIINGECVPNHPKRFFISIRLNSSFFMSEIG